MPPPVSHLIFELSGVLLDGERARAGMAAQIGQIMAGRYGGSPAAWHDTWAQIVTHWDEYHADLDFAGDEGLDAVQEAAYRTTRALFRLTGTPEPPAPDLTTLSRDLVPLAASGCDALYPDVRPALIALHGAGYRVSVTGYLPEAQVRGWLRGGGVLDLIPGGVVGVETLDRYARDTAYYERLARHLRVEPSACRVVDAVEAHLASARAAGLQAVQVIRPNSGRRFVQTIQTGYIRLDGLSTILEVVHP